MNSQLSLPFLAPLGLTLGKQQAHGCVRLVRTIFPHSSLPNLVEHAAMFPSCRAAGSLESPFLPCSLQTSHAQLWLYCFSCERILVLHLQVMPDNEPLSAASKATSAKRAHTCPCPSFYKGKSMLSFSSHCQLLRSR